MTNQDFFPKMTTFVSRALNEGNPTKRFNDIFHSTINLIELSLQIFIITTIRTYEEKFNNEDDLYRKKIKSISEILRDKYVAPSLGTQAALAKSCFYLIDNMAPIELIKMKKKLEETILMGSIAIYLGDLKKIFNSLEDSKENIANVIINENSKRTFLALINDFVAFRNESAHLVNIAKIIDDNELLSRLNLEAWKDSFGKIIGNLEPLLANRFRFKKIDKIFIENETRMVLIKNRDFFNGVFQEHYENIKLEDLHEDEWNGKTQILLSEQNGHKKALNIFPFILLKDDKLFFYKKTKASGYQYFSLIDDHIHTVKSKKKFNKYIFKTSSIANSQALFWTEVLPKSNPINNIKANIPSQGNTQFIGRKKQMNKIREEIIEIPNQNGILYGPGGVGKTALLIQLTNQLYNETNSDKALYENIIWVSAKSNFYHWEQNATISNPQQFESLENILQIVLRFFEYEDVNEYNLDELKELIFELLEENKILLVLDNFETVTKIETNRIINFFGSDVKKHLKLLPNNFKVILTSRELIPSGYYQIKLEGLETKESIQLMESIFERYKDSHKPLSIDQCN